MTNEALRQIGQVQKIDSALLELQRRFAAIDPGKVVAAHTQEARERLQASEIELKNIRSELEDLELKSKGIDQKMVSEKNRLYSGGVYNAKDAEAIERELANLKDRRGQIDDRVLELWEALEPAKVKVEADGAVLAELEAKQAEYEGKFARFKAEFEQKAAELAEIRAREVPKCDAGLFEKYDAMRKKRGGVGLSAVVEGVCTACQTAVPKKQLGDLKLGETLETCENCLRYIYLEEES